MRKAAIATRIALRTLGGGTVGVVLGFTFNGIHLWALAGEAQACAPDPVALCKSDALLGYSFDSVLIAYAATIVICIIGFVLIQWRTVPATAPLAVIVTWLLLRSYSSRLGDTLILAESPRCGSEASSCRARRWSRQTRRSRQRCHCERHRRRHLVVDGGCVQRAAGGRVDHLVLRPGLRNGRRRRTHPWRWNGQRRCDLLIRKVFPRDQQQPVSIADR